MSLLAQKNRHPRTARVCAQPDLLGWCGEPTGAILGAAPFRSTFLFSLGQSTPHTLGVEVLGIDWCAGLLPPGLVQPSGIDAVKAQFIDELQDNSLGCLVVARNRQGDATGRALRLAEFQEVSGVDVVERLDHRPTQLLRHPLALW